MTTYIWNQNKPETRIDKWEKQKPEKNEETLEYEYDLKKWKTKMEKAFDEGRDEEKAKELLRV